MFGFGKKNDEAVVEAVCSKLRPLFVLLEHRLGCMPTELTLDPYVVGYVVGSATIFAQIETSGKASTELRGRVALAALQAAFASLNMTIHEASAAMHLIPGSAEAKRGSNAAALVIGVAAGKTDRDSEPEIVAAKMAVTNMPSSIRQMLGGNERGLLINELQEQLFFLPIEALHKVTSMGTKTPLTISELVELLSSTPAGKPRYKEDALICGLNGERTRLGSRPFLILVHQHIFDQDGLTEYVYLVDTFISQAEAERAVETLNSELLSVETGEDRYGAVWLKESEGSCPCLPKPTSAASVSSLFERAFKVRASPYDTRYTSIRVVGPFSTPVVDVDLIEFANAKFALWSYFVGIGEAKLHQKQRPIPGHKKGQ